jgi:hypothetical protein
VSILNVVEHTCPHGRPLYCVARHEPDDSRLGQPLCLDCYDHVHQVVWNNQASELWRRTTEAIRKYLHRLARRRGIDPRRVRFAPAKVAEMQRRAVVHYHAIIRLDGANPLDPDLLLPPPPGFDVDDLVDAVNHATTTAFTTDPHPVNPAGWRMTWGTQNEVQPIAVNADGDVTDSMVAGYWIRTHTHTDADGAAETTLVINFLNFTGAGWRTTGDALLANTAANEHRWRQQIAREEVTDTG